MIGMGVLAFGVALAAFCQALTGFGFALTALPFLNFVIASYSDMLCVSNVLSLIVLGLYTWMLRHDAEPKKTFPVLLGFFLSCALVVHALPTFDTTFLRRVLGALLVLLGVYFWRWQSKVAIRATFRNGFLCGLLSGVLSGAFGIGGPPLAAYFLTVFADDLKKYLANVQFCALLSESYSLVMKGLMGFFTIDVLHYSLLSLPFLLLGLFLGLRLMRTLKEGRIKKIIYCMMMLSGIVTIVR